MSACRCRIFFLACALAAGCAGQQKPESSMAPPARAPEPMPVEPDEGEPFIGVPVVASGVAPEMYFRHYGVNPTVESAARPVSTFSVDVDTGSFTLARAVLERGALPQPAAVRVEEFINAFDYGYAPPTDGRTFAVHAEIFPSPSRPGFHDLALGLGAREVSAAARKSANLVFVIDVSGSMSRGDRLGAVKDALRGLLGALRADDSVAVVVYGSSARVLLPPTGGAARDQIAAAIDRLSPEGSTHMQAGLELGYSTAMRRFRPDRVNRVILCSDGVANQGITDPDALYERVAEAAKSGVRLTAVGFGLGHYNDVMMERLAHRGDGQYAYIDRPAEARRLFVDNLTGTLELVARNAKLQIEFDPSVVARYRLIGYENRVLAERDFDDDAVDAGDVGAGHEVTAIYEIKLIRSDAPLGELRMRYAPPAGGPTTLETYVLTQTLRRDDLSRISSAARLAISVASFAERLRQSYWARTVAYAAIRRQLAALPAAWRDREDVRGLDQLLATAERLDRRPDRFEPESPLANMSFDRVPVLAVQP